MKRKSNPLIGIFFASLVFTACNGAQSKQDINTVSQSGEETTISNEVVKEKPTSTPLPEPTQKPPMLATLENMEPDFEIFFDGVDCLVTGPSQVTLGEHNFILHNASDLIATLWVAVYQSEGSFEDHLAWRDENGCAHPGARCEDEDGNLKSYSLIRWLNAIKQAQEGTSVYYKVYDLNMPQEHLIYIGSNNVGWLCVPFKVGN